MKKLLILLAMTLITAVSCKSIHTESLFSYEEPREKRNFAENFNIKIKGLAIEITSNIKEFNPETRSLIVTTMVDLDSYQSTNRLGRYISERLIHELHLMGYRVFETNQAKSIKTVENKGVFHLTRQKRELLNKYRSDGVIVGTYTMVAGEFTIHARMIERDTSRILSVATANFEVTGDPFVQGLLMIDTKTQGSSMPLMAVEE